MDMDRTARGWLLNTVRANYWRVCASCDIDDLLQDGRILFIRLQRRYPDARPPHLMRLFQIAFINHLHDLSKRDCYIPRRGAKDKRGFKPEFVPLELADEEPVLCPYAELVAYVLDCPEPVRSILIALYRASGKALRQPYRIRHGHRETGGERLARLAGLPPQHGLLKLVHRHLRTAPSD